jgi:uncharacterized protein RhaS with RHS repeats
MYHYAARYYDPNIGRFSQPDPSGQEKNPYLYAEGDPVNRIDPSGLFSFADALGPAGDIGQGIGHLIEGDTKALWGDVAGVVAGGIRGPLRISSGSHSTRHWRHVPRGSDRMLRDLVERWSDRGQRGRRLTHRTEQAAWGGASPQAT